MSEENAKETEENDGEMSAKVSPTIVDARNEPKDSVRRKKRIRVKKKVGSGRAKPGLTSGENQSGSISRFKMLAEMGDDPPSLPGPPSPRSTTWRHSSSGKLTTHGIERQHLGGSSGGPPLPSVSILEPFQPPAVDGDNTFPVTGGAGQSRLASESSPIAVGTAIGDGNCPMDSRRVVPF